MSRPSKPIEAYIITKASRASNTPYQGPTCEKAGAPRGHIYSDREEAERDAQKMTEHNPVGFAVTEMKDQAHE